MRPSHLVLLFYSLIVTHATKLRYAPPGEPALNARKDGNCPEVWKQVKAELNTVFMTGDQCNGLARAAIRAVFHDCGSWDTTQKLTGGCDGSLVTGVIPDIELGRPENRGLQAIAAKIKDLSLKYETSAADMIVFAGSMCRSLHLPCLLCYLRRASRGERLTISHRLSHSAVSRRTQGQDLYRAQ